MQQGLCQTKRVTCSREPCSGAYRRRRSYGRNCEMNDSWLRRVVMLAIVLLVLHAVGTWTYSTLGFAAAIVSALLVGAVSIFAARMATRGRQPRLVRRPDDGLHGSALGRPIVGPACHRRGLVDTGRRLRALPDRVCGARTSALDRIPGTGAAASRRSRCSWLRRAEKPAVCGADLADSVAPSSPYSFFFFCLFSPKECVSGSLFLLSFGFWFRRGFPLPSLPSHCFFVWLPFPFFAWL